MNAAVGLGTDNDPFRRRQAAAASFLPAARESEDVDQDDSSDVATDVATDVAALPPPRKEEIARLQWNIRILPEHKKKIDAYQRKHGVTKQAIADQMVQEYLERRGLI